MSKLSRRERRLLRRQGKMMPIIPKKLEPKKGEEINLQKPKSYRGLQHFYNTKYKELLIIPITIFVICLILIVVKYAQTGDFINRGVSLKGGISFTFPEQNMTLQELQSFLSAKFPGKDINIQVLSELGVQNGYIVESSDINETALVSVLQEKIPDIGSKYSVQIIGSSLGSAFFKQTMWAVLIAFLGMSLVVFYFFRIPIPSIMVIICAIFDILDTLAVVNLTGMKIGTAGIAAFLMLIGYSVDTDILLTTNVLKRKEGTIYDRIYRSIKTGMTMTLTTIAALLVALIFTPSEVIKQIMIILLIGLVFDILNTWIQNVSLLRIYLDKWHAK